MNNILMQDSVRHPKLFVWNGGIVGDRLNICLQKHNSDLAPTE